MAILYDSDLDPAPIRNRKVAVPGFGARFRAHPGRRLRAMLGAIRRVETE